MTERTERADRRPLGEVETDDYRVNFHLFCSASEAILKTFETAVFCRPGQSLGQAVSSKIKFERFRHFIGQRHMKHCRIDMPPRGSHDVYINVEVIDRPTPPDFGPDFLVIRGK